MNCYECFARVASEDRELNLRPWAIGLGLGERVTPDRLVFVIFVLASVTYDSIARNPAMGGTGKACLYAPSIGDHSGADVFLAIYLAFVKLSQLFAGGYIPFRRLAATYVHSLVPIAIAYQVAHYYTLLLIQGQAIIALLSDPFGWGSNLFGTVDYKVHAGLIGADAVWYKQVAVIVAATCAIYGARRSAEIDA